MHEYKMHLDTLVEAGKITVNQRREMLKKAALSFYHDAARPFRK